MCAVAKHPAYFWEDTLTHSAEHNINEPNPADEGEATKPAETILRQGIAIGEEQLERKSLGLMLSAVSAGLDVGFGPLMVASVLAASPSDTWGSRLIAPSCTPLASSSGDPNSSPNTPRSRCYHFCLDARR